MAEAGRLQVGGSSSCSAITKYYVITQNVEAAGSTRGAVLSHPSFTSFSQQKQ